MCDMGFLKNFLGSRKEVKPGRVVSVYDDTFEAEVLRSDLPVVVDFWASWCMPCQVMSGLMNELAKEYGGRIKVLKMNVDESRNTAAHFGIRSIPTVLFFRDGRKVGEIVGLLHKNDLALKFDRLLEST